MAELESLNHDVQVETIEFIRKIDVELDIKKEVDVRVKPEPQECVMCSNRGRDGHDIYSTNTASGASLHDFLYKFTRVDISVAENCPKYMCKTCFELINVLEAAEQEYIKLKQTFEEIISRNPLFDQLRQPIELSSVKTEVFDEIYNRSRDNGADSEDEPLAITKKKRHRKPEKTKKKSITKSVTKRQTRNSENKDRYVVT